MKNSNDAIGNRIRELPSSSAVPQPNAPPRAVRWTGVKNNGLLKDSIKVHFLNGRKGFATCLGKVILESGMGKLLNILRTGLLNCLNARSRGLNFRHRASCI